MPRENITRVSVDLTLDQREALDRMIDRMSAEVSQAAGIPIRFGVREFIHVLLKRHAEAVEIAWPENYPMPGGVAMAARPLTPADVVTAALPHLRAQARAGRDRITLYWPRSEPSPTWGDLAAALDAAGYDLVHWQERRDGPFALVRERNGDEQSKA